jgi:hypothetical protein
MAGLPLQSEDHLDGISWVSQLSGVESPSARPLFWHNPAPRLASTGDWFSSAVREGCLKLLEFPEWNRVELYDLSSDPGEMLLQKEQSLGGHGHTNDAFVVPRVDATVREGWM